MGAVGVGQIIDGRWSDRPGLVVIGRCLAGLGLAIFLVGFVFFELVLNISGFSSGSVGRVVGPVLLIGAGLYLLLGRRRSADRPAAGGRS